MQISRIKLSFYPFLSAVIVLAATSLPAHAIPAVTVISPKTGSTAGSPVFYEAYATSPGCAKGIASMRVYSAPGVSAFSVNGAHMETFIPLSPGSYSTVVEASDNCGGVGQTAVNLTVSSTAGVSVFLPNSASATSPVHIAASAQNSSCAAGINAIRVYVASATSPYTINSNQLNAYINLLPGTRQLTVQAWDNCGHVFKTQLSKSITTTPDANLYAVNLNGTASTIYQFKIAVDGTLQNPNGAGKLPEVSAGSGADTLAVDPGGWFLYASTINNIYGYQVNPANGKLRPMPGSPFPLNDSNNVVPPVIQVDPSGNFLFARYGGAEVGRATTYRINRSTGALTSTGFVIGTAWYVFAFDFSGQYLYVINYGGVDGYRLNPNNGAMTVLPGSTFFFSSMNSLNFPSMASTGNYLYVGGNGVAGGSGGGVWAFSINYGTGALTEMTGSPFLPSSASRQVFSVLADWRTRFLWSLQQDSSAYGMQEFGINSAGGLLASSWFTDLSPYSLGHWTEDHSGKFIFTSYNGSSPNTGVASWPISTTGDLQTQTVFPTANPIGSIAAARKKPR